MSWQGAKKYWTADIILLAIRSFHDRYNRWPETKEFNNDQYALPNSVTVTRAFGTLAEARRQAGMPGGGHEGRGGGGRGGFGPVFKK